MTGFLGFVSHQPLAWWNIIHRSKVQVPKYGMTPFGRQVEAELFGKKRVFFWTARVGKQNGGGGIDFAKKIPGCRFSRLKEIEQHLEDMGVST